MSCVITEGSLRFGTTVEFHGKQVFAWRHWGCVTREQLENVKAQFEEASELDGFEDLKEEDQERVKKAYEDGHVADEDIPDTAREPAGDEDEED
ncbi:hypothetical protein AAF712_008836 [Marasmius tenuissimus]|uniref:PARP-type domain-containing protein n=1 Tax=Marasmius tenuissimus TaxID=585030 RepID=A0ABR2ZRD6_9AGAR|nr:hypothetical protein PM082_018039 [Marasmius tenuissimus]